MKDAEIVRKAVAEYRRGDPLTEIAARHSVSIGAVSLWAKKAGVIRRIRGRRIRLLPSEIDMQIVAAVKASVNGRPTLAEIGAPWGYGRAGIHRIYHKWKDWVPTVPFKKKDIVRIGQEDYEVLEAGVFDGLCRHVAPSSVASGGMITRMRWVQGQGKSKVVAVKI